jgi:hypothetical protein
MTGPRVLAVSGSSDMDFPARYFPSILHFFLCSLNLNLLKGLGAGIVCESGGMEKEEKKQKNCTKKEMHVDFPARYFPTILFSVHCT